MTEFFYQLSVWALPVIIAITFHEVAHGFAAYHLGDDTARQQGRLSLNPLRHVDPFGTLALPVILLIVQKVILSMQTAFLFGYAKPVPVDFSRLKKPRRDMVLVALAGPAINIFLAVVCIFLFILSAHIPDAAWQSWVMLNLFHGLLINVVLAAFNMIPLPPLDGSRVVAGFMPPRIAAQYMRLEKYGIFILLLLLLVVPYVGEKLGYSFNPLLSLLNIFVYYSVLTLDFVSGWF